MKPLKGPLPPGSHIGILGGGQLGRMLAMAAGRLGYKTIVFAPDEDCIAAAMADQCIKAGYTDRQALSEFADICDVVTIEFENVPAETLSWLAQTIPVGPAAAVLAITQDRLAEKTFVNSLGIGVADFAAIDQLDDLIQALADFGGQGILKTRRFGYDGKGQVRIGIGDDPARALEAIGRQPAILEAFVPFLTEISVITARSHSGAIASYPAVENKHQNGILAETTAPAPIEPDIGREAVKIAEIIAAHMDLVGIIATEMFLLANGQILVNEMAPRPHNSGHWTIDACVVSQFEQTIRAICDLPLGDACKFRPAVMRNLIGHDVDQWPNFLSDPQARLHLYGKKEVRDGRKMGHVTWVN